MDSDFGLFDEILPKTGTVSRTARPLGGTRCMDRPFRILAVRETVLRKPPRNREQLGTGTRRTKFVLPDYHIELRRRVALLG